jgi:lipopolysaccharide/colanic/teichoic acid biosynthesis glycosyltransferase
VLKDLFDRCTARLALILLSPLMLALAVAIRLSDGGPALFTQTRVGKDGQAFKIYKFRTVIVDAEQRLAGLQASNDFDGVLFKMRRDPRVTAIGGWLRKWSLDELPQLFNIMLGEMSLVGPRPALPDEAAGYADHVRRRLVVKPGLTGLWQVSGRSDLTWDESVRLDLRYVENWSLALDLQILWKTIGAMLNGSGDYYRSGTCGSLRLVTRCPEGRDVRELDCPERDRLCSASLAGGRARSPLAYSA